MYYENEKPEYQRYAISNRPHTIVKIRNVEIENGKIISFIYDVIYDISSDFIFYIPRERYTELLSILSDESFLIVKEFDEDSYICRYKELGGIEIRVYEFISSLEDNGFKINNIDVKWNSKLNTIYNHQINIELEKNNIFYYKGNKILFEGEISKEIIENQIKKRNDLLNITEGDYYDSDYYYMDLFENYFKNICLKLNIKCYYDSKHKIYTTKNNNEKINEYIELIINKGYFSCGYDETKFKYDENFILYKQLKGCDEYDI